MSGVRMQHFSKDLWKLVQIHKYYTMALIQLMNIASSISSLLENDYEAKPYPDKLPRRTILHRTGFGPDEWFYSVVVVLVGSCPGGE